MQISDTVLAVVRAAEDSGEPVNHWVVGGGALLVLLLLLAGLVLFGGGRDHT